MFIKNREIFIKKFKFKIEIINKNENFKSILKYL